MKWIDINERLPEKDGYYIVESEFTGSGSLVPHDRSDTYFRNGKFEMINWKAVKWLDESPTPSEGKGYSLEDMEACFAEGVNAGVTINDLPTPRHRFKDFIASLPPQPVKDDWVSCEDGLPDEGGEDNGTEVMTYPHYINCMYGIFINARSGNKDTGFYSFDGEFDGDTKIHGVTHWRSRLPLPHPPAV